MKTKSSITVVKKTANRKNGSLNARNVEEFVSSITFRLESLRCLALCTGLAIATEEIPSDHVAWVGRGLAFAIDDLNARMRAGFDELKKTGDSEGYLFSSSREWRLGEDPAELEESTDVDAVNAAR